MGEIKKYQRDILNDKSLPESLKKSYQKACKEINKEFDIVKKGKYF